MNPNVSQKVPVSVVAFSGGVVVDLGAFPTAFTDVEFNASGNAVVSFDDNAQAFVSCPDVGDVTVTASGKNVKGETVSGSAVVTFEAVPVPVVDSLTVKVGDPVAA